MGKNSFALILGNQLFPKKSLKKLSAQQVLMIEDHGLCTHYKYHKHKIILFLAAMRHYRDDLQDQGYKLSYYDTSHELFEKSFEEKLLDFLKQNKNVERVELFEVEDKFFEERLTKFFKKQGLSVEVLPSPMFMCSRPSFEKYLSSRKKPFMKTFYELQRKKFSVLLTSEDKPVGGQWSFDKENRKKLPKGLSLPKHKASPLSDLTREVSDQVEKLFPKHLGSSAGFRFAVTRKEALKQLKLFIKERFEHFGAYQDALSKDDSFLFHSLLSPAINMGLILPEEIIELVEKEFQKNPQRLPLNSVEGFIRQLLGWREFVRGIYQNYSEKQWESNYWGHERRMKPCWYSGETGIPILDDSIKRAVKYSYSNHIERLMVLSNIMLLSELHPHEVYKWFMELYADSSDWVMGPNVFGMGQFSDGGIFATKPYTCGSNYYLKMSDYKKGEWCDTVDGLYWRFIEKHEAFYKKNPRMSIMVGSLKKMDKERKKRIFAAAESFIEKTTKVK